MRGIPVIIGSWAASTADWPVGLPASVSRELTIITPLTLGIRKGLNVGEVGPGLTECQRWLCQGSVSHCCCHIYQIMWASLSEPAGKMHEIRPSDGYRTIWRAQVLHQYVWAFIMLMQSSLKMDVHHLMKLSFESYMWWCSGWLGINSW